MPLSLPSPVVLQSEETIRGRPVRVCKGGRWGWEVGVGGVGGGRGEATGLQAWCVLSTALRQRTFDHFAPFSQGMGRRHCFGDVQ